MIGSMRRHAAQGLPIYVLLIALIVLTGALSEDFRDPGNLQNLADRMAPLAVLALAQTVVILVGGIDLSVGAMVSLVTVILSFTGRDATIGIMAAVPLVLVLGAAFGAINGLGVVALRLDPLIMTLASSAVLQGLALFLRQSPGGLIDPSFADALGQRPLGVPGGFILAILLFALVWMLLSYTRVGRAMYAVGGNLESARESGIGVDRTRLLAYVLAGLLAAAAGVLLAARIHAGDPVVGNSMTLDSVAAAIVGGTPFPGGSGGPVGTFGGAGLLAIIGNVLNMLNVSAYYQYIIKGLILASALVFFFYRRRETSHALA
jgi:ribose transport system permease protein